MSSQARERRRQAQFVQIMDDYTANKISWDEMDERIKQVDERMDDSRRRINGIA